MSKVVKIATRDESLNESVDFSSLSKAARGKIVEYGMQRWFLDYVHTRAMADKRDGKEVDMQKYFNERLASAKGK